MRLNSRFEIFQWMMIHLKCLLLLYKSLAVAWSVIPFSLLPKIYCIREKKNLMRLLVIESSTEGVNLTVFSIWISFCVPNLVYWLRYFKFLHDTHHSSWFLNTFLSNVTNLCHMFCSHPLLREQVLNSRIFLWFWFLGGLIVAHKSFTKVLVAGGRGLIMDSPLFFLCGICSHISSHSLSTSYSPGRSDSHAFSAHHLLFSSSQILHLDSVSCPTMVIALHTHCFSHLFFWALLKTQMSLSSKELLIPGLLPLAPNSYFYHLLSHQSISAAVPKENFAGSQILRKPKHLTRG